MLTRMSVKFAAPRLHTIPWLVLLVALTLTAGGVAWRYRAVDAGGDTAVRSAEGHFNDVVSDHERQILDGQREIEVVLLGATMGGPDPIETDDVSSRLARLGSEGLAGIRGFVLVSADAGGTVVADLGDGIDDPMLAPLVDVAASPSPSPDRPWVATLSTGSHDLVVVAVGAPSGDSLLAVFDADEFILGARDHQSHHVMAQLSGSTTASSSASGGLSMGDTGPVHENQVIFQQSGQARFASRCRTSTCTARRGRSPSYQWMVSSRSRRAVRSR